MSDFNEDKYLRDMDGADSLKGNSPTGDSLSGDSASPQPDGFDGCNGSVESDGLSPTESTDSSQQGAVGDGSELTPLGKAKKEAADYLEALQRERASFVNFRNRAAKEQERFREHGIIDVLTALLPALDDLDRIDEHGDLPDSLKPVVAKIDKAFTQFNVEKFGEKGEDFDPTKHDAILHKPDASATSETVDTVVEAGYRIGDRVIRAARVVVASPSNGEK